MKPDKHWHPDWRDALIRHQNELAGRAGGGPPHPLLALDRAVNHPLRVARLKAAGGLPPPPPKAKRKAKPAPGKSARELNLIELIARNRKLANQHREGGNAPPSPHFGG